MKKSLLIAAALCACVAANAQSGNFGVVNYFSDFYLSRVHQLSTFDTNLSTARSAAMGGAFTSLGADLSSMHINPAGLGMYRMSDFGITMGPSISNVRNSMRGEQSVSDSRTSFALNNFGAAFNMFESSGSTTSFSFGVGYSRLADYNYRSRMTIANGSHSILQMFDAQLDNGDVDNNYRDAWGAKLAWNTDLLRAQPDGSSYVPVLAADASVLKKMNETSRGSAGEYTFGAGWNFQNKFYAGFSMGIVDIYQNREMTYSEDYNNNAAAVDPVDYMDYTQYVRTIGNGFNMKMGLVYRPLPELRLGLAFHTPTWISVRSFADYKMTAGYPDEEKWAAPELEEEYQDEFYTPARLLAGVSYTFFESGVLAIDYERAFYNGMGLYGDLYNLSTTDAFRDNVRAHFQGSDALRVGLEVMASDVLSLRAGYGFTRDGIRNEIIDDPTGLDLPIRRESSVFSAGFGMKIGNNTSLDMTWSMLDAKMTDYEVFYYNQNGTEFFAGTDAFARTQQKLRRHNIMLSLSYRF